MTTLQCKIKSIFPKLIGGKKQSIFKIISTVSSGSKRIEKYLLDSTPLLLISSRERMITGRTDSALRLDLSVFKISTSSMNKI